jgi:hypothetical protein
VAIALSARPPWPPSNARAHKLFEPDLNRRGSGGSEGTIYLRSANAALFGMIARSMRRAFSRDCLACPSAKDQTNVKQDGQNRYQRDHCQKQSRQADEANQGDEDTCRQ